MQKLCTNCAGCKLRPVGDKCKQYKPDRFGTCLQYTGPASEQVHKRLSARKG